MIVFGLSTQNFLLFDEIQRQCHFVVVIGSSYCRCVELAKNQQIFREFVPKNPAKSDFFFRNLSEALPGIDLVQKREPR